MVIINLDFVTILFFLESVNKSLMDIISSPYKILEC